MRRTLFHCSRVDKGYHHILYQYENKIIFQPAETVPMKRLTPRRPLSSGEPPLSPSTFDQKNQ